MSPRKIAQLPEDDQQLVRLIRNLIVGLVAALLLLGAAVVGTFLRGENTRSIVTRVPACERDASGAECQETLEKAAKAQSREVACITIRQGGYPCPRPGSRAAEMVEPEPSTEGAGAGGGDPPVVASPPPGSTGAAEPVKPGSEPAPDDGGSEGSPEPAPTNPSLPPTALNPVPSPTSPPPSASPPAERGPAAAVLEGARSTVNEALEGVHGVGCQLVPLCRALP